MEAKEIAKLILEYNALNSIKVSVIFSATLSPDERRERRNAINDRLEQIRKELRDE